MEDRENTRKQIENLLGDIKSARRAHWAVYGRLKKKLRTLKLLDITLTAVSSVGIISFFFHGNYHINIITSFVTLSSLSLNLYTSNFRDDEDKSGHCNAANELWLVEKALESLLVDFDSLPLDEIRKKRDTLLKETAAINGKYYCLDDVSLGKFRRLRKTEKEGGQSTK